MEKENKNVGVETKTAMGIRKNVKNPGGGKKKELQMQQQKK